MFVKHFKSTLGPQDDDEEPHTFVAHMYAITETMNALQAMVRHQQQLLDLHHAMTCQDETYKSFAEQQWSKQLTLSNSLCNN